MSDKYLHVRRLWIPEQQKGGFGARLIELVEIDSGNGPPLRAAYTDMSLETLRRLPGFIESHAG